MVLGLRSKTRKGSLFQVDYLVHIKEISPWPPSQSLRSVQSVLLQWENGDQSSGSSLASSIGNGKVEFSESFRLPLILCQEASRKSSNRDSFQKNYLEFYLYEPKKDKVTKGQLLGSAILNLADYGIIKESISISIAINFKKSSRNAEQSVLYLNVQPFDKGSSSSSTKGSLSKEVSLDKDGSESVAESINEGNDEESEIASFTDDDDDDDLSSHSSRTISSSHSQHDKNGSESANGVVRPGLTIPSGRRVNSGESPVFEAFKQVNGNTAPSPSMLDLSSKTGNPINDPMGKVTSSKAGFTIPIDRNSDNVRDKDLHTATDVRMAWKHEKSHVDRSLSTNSHVGHRKENELDSQISDTKKHSVENKLGFRPPQDSMRKHVKLRSNTFASSLATTEGQSGFVANDRREHAAPAQIQFDKAKSNGMSNKNQFMEKEKEIDIPENIPNGAPKDTLSERLETANGFSNCTVESAKSCGLPNKTQLIEKMRENGIAEKVNNGTTSCTCNRSEETAKSNSDGKVMESKIKMLEEELREAAVVEASLYSIVAEHGSSTNKVHAPARRLSRFYLHACKAGTKDKRANAARTAVSGLVLVSKACGNDVPRLTFWLSNSIVLRAIISHAIGEMPPFSEECVNHSNSDKVLEDTSPLDKEESNSTECHDEWEDPQTFLLALEKFEAWTFSRIVESVWWQTLTPYMQSAAAKSSSSRKTSNKKYGLGDLEQGNFSVELWKKAFKDSCERLCPIRASGHECGCLAVLAKLVMEQLVSRLDVAMFNAILRQSANEMPTDPVSDPISDSKVLPIPAGKSSFGAGVQLKNAIGNWSRWLTDLFGIDDNDEPEDGNEVGDAKSGGCEASFKVFSLLNALSDLMMLPSEMLADRSTRKEVCPKFSAAVISRVLYNFVPDEFNPNPVSEAIFEVLEEDGDESLSNFPCMASPTVYLPPSPASLTGIIGEVGSQALQRSKSSVLRKSYTSDDELEELDSPITSIMIENHYDSPTSKAPPSWMQTGNGGRKVVRYQLLRGIWKDGE